MSRRALCVRSSAVALASLLAAASLSACNKSGGGDDVSQASAGAALPLTTAEGAPSQPAPPVSALPAAAPAPIVRVQNPDDEYAYLDEAYYQGDAFEDAPPDYSFDYDGVSPWTWQSAEGALELVEPEGEGYRYYYYQPGAAYPYLVRDDGYSYGFDGPDLVVVYDSYGRVLPPDEVDRRAGDAGRYLARAEALHRASRTADRRAVVAAQWAAGRTQIAAQRAQWAQARSRQSAWRTYDGAHAAQQTNFWRPEQARRQQSAQRFAQWRSANFQGSPPVPVGGPRDATTRQAQDQEQRSFPPASPAPPLPDQRRQQADQQQRPAQQQADQLRQADDQGRQQAAQQQQQRLAQQQADQRRQADDRGRQQAAQQQQQRLAQQQADQRRQADDQGRQQAAQQRRLVQQQANQRRQPVEQQRPQAAQAPQPQRQPVAQQSRPQPQPQPQAQAQAQAKPQPPQEHDAHQDHGRGHDEKPG